MSKFDRGFVVWCAIWLAWFVLFVGLTVKGWPTVATVVAVTSFCWLWPRFCDMMQRA